MGALKISAAELIEQVLDAGSFESWDSPPERSTSIGADYQRNLDEAAAKSGVDESIITGAGTIEGQRVAFALGEFAFLAGSVGRDAADRLVTSVHRATAEGLPLLASPVSGGTRMQEGTPAFVQMVRIAEAVTAHKAAGLPYLVYLRHPTTGGVMATWGSLGHLTAASPGALVGFLGPRVYEALYNEPFPENVQTAENLVARGVIDGVYPPESLRVVLKRTLRVLHSKESEVPAHTPNSAPLSPPDAWEAIQSTRRPERPGVKQLLEQAADVVVFGGTRAGERDPAILLALARFGGTGCVVIALDREAQTPEPTFGPAALRTARRGAEMAEELGLPLVSVIDTPGAVLSEEAENGALASEIARTLADLVSVRTPSVSLLLGQGNGGGALAMLPADRVLAVHHSWLTPLPPEGASAIVYRTTERAPEMARAQHIGAHDLAARGVVDRIIDELPDAADEPEAFSQRVASVLCEELAKAVAAGPGSSADRVRRYEQMPR